MPQQRIYFDPDDEARDGNGWNIVDANSDSGVALRFPTLAQCTDWCERNGFPYREF